MRHENKVGSVEQTTNIDGKNRESFATPSSLNLSRIPNNELMLRLDKLARTERRLTHLILCHINEVDSRKLHLALGFDSIYKYLVGRLGYSEDAAYHRMQAARLLKQNPEIQTKLEDGTLKLSQLVKVSTALNQQKKVGKEVPEEITKEIFQQLENKTLSETLKILARELDQPVWTHQQVKPQKDDSVRLEVTLTREQYEVLQKAQSLISHSVPDNSIADAITYLAKCHIKKVEGKTSGRNLNTKEDLGNENLSLRDIPRVIARKSVPRKSVTRVFRLKRNYISVKTKREVFAEADHCCAYVHPSTRQRCGSKYQLQIDHIKPKAKGGGDDPQNLRLLCGIHNRIEALKRGL